MSGITAEQLVEVRAQMKALIEGSSTAATFTRYRINTDSLPASWDGDYGEVGDYADIIYTSLEVTGQIFYEISEHDLYGVLGGDIEVSCYVHLAYDTDVKARDYLVGDSQELVVFKVVSHESYLQIFCKEGSRPQAKT